MFKLTKKGQASSTFQLLIAAIVALAILGVLISVIGGINTVSGDAKTAATQKLKTQMQNPGSVDCTDAVTFKKANTLAAEGVTKDTGLDPEQVFFTNEIDNISNFNATGNAKAILKYTGTSSKRVVLCVLCSSNGKTGLDEAIKANELMGSPNTSLSEAEWPSPTDGRNGFPASGETGCVIYPKKTA